MAEICSAYPSAGSVYHWGKRPLSLITAFSNSLRSSTIATADLPSPRLHMLCNKDTRLFILITSLKSSSLLVMLYVLDSCPTGVERVGATVLLYLRMVQSPRYVMVADRLGIFP